jgi:hypothetical protein
VCFVHRFINGDLKSFYKVFLADERELTASGYWPHLVAIYGDRESHSLVHRSNPRDKGDSQQGFHPIGHVTC